MNLQLQIKKGSSKNSQISKSPLISAAERRVIYPSSLLQFRNLINIWKLEAQNEVNSFGEHFHCMLNHIIEK